MSSAHCLEACMLSTHRPEACTSSAHQQLCIKPIGFLVKIESNPCQGLFLVARRVTLAVVLGFSPKILGRWQGFTNGILSFYKRRLSSSNIQWGCGHSNSTCCHQIHLIFLHSEAVGMLKHLAHTPRTLLLPVLNESPGESFTT